MDIKFSVIMPVYRAENYLEKSIQTVLQQSYYNFELIIIDDGSPDSCPVICDKYANKANVKVIHQANAGVSIARNNGVIVSAGDVLCFLDADDEWN